MAAQDGEALTRRQRRAPMACEFCRHRKMKCNNEKPTCQNCKQHKKDCAYTELEKRPRPSIARISQLEKENRKLQDELANLRQRLQDANSPTTVDSPADHTDSPILVLSSKQDKTPACMRSLDFHLRPRIHDPAPSSARCATTTRAFSPDKESNYHGPSSTVFDEKTTETLAHQDRGDVVNVPDVWVKRQLVAESANQRQLETVNLLSGKLDFDGIDSELGTHLLSIYWSRQQSLGPIVYRTAFMRDMACGGPYFSKLLLNAIYFYACKYTSRVEVRQDPNNRLTAGWYFRQKAIELLKNSFDKSDIPTIQALLLMSTALFSWCDEKSTSWLYAGMAFNMIIDLGIQVDPGSATMRRRLSEEDAEIRIRVFWGAYVFDKLQSLYQGRPASLSSSCTNLPISFLDDNDELELFNPISYSQLSNFPIAPVYSISTFTESCKLSIILEKILSSIYAESSSSRQPRELARELDILDTELDTWRKSLPLHLDSIWSDSMSKAPLPHLLSLLATFNVLKVLLHRPFVSDGHLHAESSSIALKAFSVCCTAAFEIDRILEIYQNWFCFKSTPHIVSYAIYVSATILVRVAAQSSRGSNAHRALRKCLDVLDVQQSVCWSPRRAKKVIDALISRMGVVLEEGRDRENSFLASPTLDIDAIIKTFARQHHVSEAMNQDLPSYLESSQALPALPGSLQPEESHAHESYQGLTLSTATDDMTLFYDPIFGFNGSALDDLDFGFEGGLAWDQE